MQDNVIEIETNFPKLLKMQGKLIPEEQELVKGITRYSHAINMELESMGLEKVKPNKIHQVVGGFCANTTIQIAARRLIRKYQNLNI